MAAGAPPALPQDLLQAGYVTEFGNRLKDAAALLKRTNARIVQQVRRRPRSSRGWERRQES